MPLLHPPEQRRRAGALIAIGILAVAAGILVLAALRNTKRPLPAAASNAEGTASIAVFAVPPPVSAEVDASPPTIAPSASVVPEPAPVAKVKTAPVAKPTVSPSEAPKPAPAPKEPDQFGGVGVSSSF